MSAAGWIDAFLEMMAVERAAARNTLTAYGKDLADAQGFLTGRGCDLADAAAEDVEAYFLRLGALGLSAATAARRRASVRGFYRFVLGEGWRLVRREYPTPIGPVDLMCRDALGVSAAIEIKRRGEIDGSNSDEGAASRRGAHVAVEVKRHAGIDAVEQLTRYLELLNRDPLLAPVKGVLAAQTIKPQARTLAEDRGIRCVVLDYDAMRGIEHEGTLF